MTQSTHTEAQAFLDAVNEAQSILLCAHVSPDGDTLGSMLGLAFLIQHNVKRDITVHTTVSGKIAENFAFLPGVNDIRNAEDPAQLLPQYDLAISLDCGAVERLGKAQAFFGGATQSVNIDHHYSNLRFGTLNIIDEFAGASGEVVMDLANALGWQLNADAANNLYVAILTDTGGFKYSSTSAKIFAHAAQLTAAGANPEKAFRHIYDECPKSQLVLHADAILKTQFTLEDKLAWISIPHSMLDTHSALEEHIEGLVEQIRRIRPVLIAAVLRETASGKTKISLRSDTDAINVAEILAHFGGGGHRLAAGALLDTPLQETEKQLLPHLEAAIKAL